jgi:hypothetical protein
MYGELSSGGVTPHILNFATIWVISHAPSALRGRNVGPDRLGGEDPEPGWAILENG